MRKFVVIIAVILCALPLRAHAHDMDMSLPEDAGEARLVLAERMHEIWPTRQRVERAVAQIASRMPEEEAQAFREVMRLAIDFSKLEEISIQAMADTFTVAELKAMVTYYGSEAGQGAESKTSRYVEKIQPAITRMVDKALMAYRTGDVPEAGQSRGDNSGETGN
jgi:hypothetical protein